MNENLPESQEMARREAEINASADLQKRLRRTALCALPVILSVALQRFYDKGESLLIVGWAQLLLTTLAVIFAASRFYVSRYASLAGDVYAQVTFLVGLAGVYLIALVKFLTSNPPNAIDEFGTAAFIALIFSLRNWALANFFVLTDGKAEKILQLEPLTARVVGADDSIHEVAAHEVKIGDILEVNSGETLAADGEIVAGFTAVDEKFLSGAEITIEKTVTHKIYAASTSTEERIRVRVERTNENVLYRRIARSLIGLSQEETPLYGRSARFERTFLLALWATTLTVGIFRYRTAAENPLLEAVAQMSAVCFLSAASFSCLSVRAALNNGLSRVADWGAILKNASVIEKIAALETVIFDKTGTLTSGTPHVVEVLTDGSISEDEAIQKIAAAEQFSFHPIAKALCEEANMLGLSLPEVENFSEISGYGVEAFCFSEKITIGRAEFLSQQGISIENLAERAEDFSASGHTVVFLAVDDAAKGFAAVSYQISAQAKNAVNELREEDLDVQMMSADNPQAAYIIARRAGIKEVLSEVGTANKIARIKQIQHKNRRVAVVGDGENDALLKSADVGIILGGAEKFISDANDADLYLMRHDLGNVAQALRIIRKTLQVARQNLLLMTIYHIFVIAACLLSVVVFRSHISPIFAVLLAACAAACVCLNALRLKLAS